jgi:hypothetical protein
VVSEWRCTLRGHQSSAQELLRASSHAALRTSNSSPHHKDMGLSSAHRSLLCVALVVLFSLAPCDANLIRGNHTNNWAVLVRPSPLSYRFQSKYSLKFCSLIYTIYYPQACISIYLIILSILQLFIIMQVDTSRFWFNYRHIANVLGIYRSIKRLGIPDSQSNPHPFFSSFVLPYFPHATFTDDACGRHGVQYAQLVPTLNFLLSPTLFLSAPLPLQLYLCVRATRNSYPNTKIRKGSQRSTRIRKDPQGSARVCERPRITFASTIHLVLSLFPSHALFHFPLFFSSNSILLQLY